MSYWSSKSPMMRCWPNEKIHAGIMTKAAKVDRAVIVTDRFKLPPNMTVQMLDAPPPGEQPVTNSPSLTNKVHTLW